MPQCKVDLEKCRYFGRTLAKLRKKYRRIDEDLVELKASIQKDYTSYKIGYTVMRAPGRPDLQQKFVKYDCACQDINKHARESLRLLCIWSDDKTTLYGVHLYLRDNNDHFTPKELAEFMKEFKASFDSPDEEAFTAGSED